MNLKSVKNSADTGIAGLELIKKDKAIYGVVIGKVRIESDYGLRVFVEEPFQTETRYRVTAEIDGFDPKVSHFSYEHEATSAARDFEAKGATANVVKIEALINDAGEVVGQHEGERAVKGDGVDVPF